MLRDPSKNNSELCPTTEEVFKTKSLMVMTLKLKGVDGNGLLVQVVADVEDVEGPAPCNQLLGR